MAARSTVNSFGSLAGLIDYYLNTFGPDSCGKVRWHIDHFKEELTIFNKHGQEVPVATRAMLFENDSRAYWIIHIRGCLDTLSEMETKLCRALEAV